MRNKELIQLSLRAVAKRSRSIPIICVIGPTGSGKTTWIYAVLNHRIVGIIQVGIGEKKQTTIIPTNFICDERIKDESQVALKVKIKQFAAKDVHYNVMAGLASVFTDKDIDAEDRAEYIDDDWLDEVLEPEDKAYHLYDIKKCINISKMKEIMAMLMDAVETANPKFEDRVRERKNIYPKSSKKPMTEIKRMVFEEVIESLGKDNHVWIAYYNWLNEIGHMLEQKLCNLLGEMPSEDRIYEFNLEEGMKPLNGERVLKELFNPYRPYSLIVEEMTLISRPRKEVIELNKEDFPLRFCLRDTMGLNQIESSETYIKDALDMAISTMPDSILLLLNMEERDKTLSESCDAIEKKLKEASKLDVPVRVILTKADRIIEAKVNLQKEAVAIQLDDYKRCIIPAIDSLNELKRPYEEIFKNQRVEWISLRYHEESIDPIQLSLKEHNSDDIIRFKPEGLYNSVYALINETQKRVLPAGIEYPVFVTVKDDERQAVEFETNVSLLIKEINEIQNMLVSDLATRNGYLITAKERIHGRSVVCYHNNLKRGMGHTTHATVYGNFSINMKGLLAKLLREYIPGFLTLYNAKVVKTIIDNLSPEDVKKLIIAMDSDESLTDMALKDVNPTLIECEEDKNAQIMHYIFKSYFQNDDKYYAVIDKVAKELSYNNGWICTQIEEIYQLPISYDETIRSMQEKFLEIFSTREFCNLVAVEIGRAMTELANKIFIVI